MAGRCDSATGSGKTFTAVTQAYHRLIKHAGAKRILFLVDRGNLGRQTVNEPSGARQTARKGSPKGERGGADQFQQFTTPDDGRKFTDLYNVRMLGPGGIDPVCKVTVSTIQRLYSQLSGNATFDDEADEHSGYEIAGATAGKDPLEVRYNPKIPIESFDFVIIDDFKDCYTGRDSRPAGPKSSPQATKSADRAGLPYQRKETERFRKARPGEIP